MTGPYDTESAALAEPMPREVAALHAAGRIRSGDPDRLVYNVKLLALTDACDQSGVALGAYDEGKLEWVAAWESTTVQVVIGLIRRAYDAGLAARTDTDDEEDR